MGGEFSRIQATVFLNAGFQYFLAGDMDRAIAETRMSLAQAAIGDGDRHSAKNNLAYYLAAKERRAIQDGRRALTSGEADEAEGFAFEVRQRYRRGSASPYGNVEMLETFAFVRATFADVDRELAEARDEINRLMNTEGTEVIRPELQDSLRYLEGRAKRAGAPNNP